MLGFLRNVDGFDGLVILVVALLVFGRNLPEVGRNLGKVAIESRSNLLRQPAPRDHGLSDQTLLLIAIVITLLLTLLWLLTHAG